jgi:hypothetical protein
MRSRLFALLALATLACSLLSPAGPTATPAPSAAYLGQFDCYGSEGGLGAYAGRVTLQPGGVVTLKDYDGLITTGTWTYDAAANAFAFTGAIGLASASYAASSDTLTVALAPSAALVHAEGGHMQCQRAQPGITGPP